MSLCKPAVLVLGSDEEALQSDSVFECGKITFCCWRSHVTGVYCCACTLYSVLYVWVYVVNGSLYER